jgi:hypothetical protein
LLHVLYDPRLGVTTVELSGVTAPARNNVQGRPKVTLE